MSRMRSRIELAARVHLAHADCVDDRATLSPRTLPPAMIAIRPAACVDQLSADESAPSSAVAGPPPVSTRETPASISASSAGA